MLMRKRKAESQANERLSKRLSLLNLEKSGQRLYVPVESPHLEPVPDSELPPLSAFPTSSPSSSFPLNSSSHSLSSSTARDPSSTAAIPDDDGGDGMRLDDTKHKVYIYDLDAELSSSDESASPTPSCPGSPSSSRPGSPRLVFLPDIDRHLKRTRIPPSVFASPDDGSLAGHTVNDMQMVLYRDAEPSSLSVPRELDSVRRAILDARARMKARRKEEEDDSGVEGDVEGNGKARRGKTLGIAPSSLPNSTCPSTASIGGYNGGFNTLNGSNQSCNEPSPASSGLFGSHDQQLNGTGRQSKSPWHQNLLADNDDDAMDTD